MDSNSMKLSAPLLILVLILSSGCDRKNEPVNLKVGLQPDGSILVPSNQLLRPAGFQVYLPGRPVDLALSPDEKFLLVKNRVDLDMIRLSDRTVMQSLPFTQGGASFTGMTISHDGSELYVTNARDLICVAHIDGNNIMQWREPIILKGPSIGGLPVPGDLVLNDSGDRIYVTLSRNNTLAIIDLNDNSQEEIPVGISPYSVICHSRTKAYVSNWGGRPPEGGESYYHTSGSKVLVDPETGIANSGSVSVVDLDKKIQIKTIETGLHPCGMVLSPDRSRLYVACANSDIISVINTSA
ncbi:MAG: YncE family protein, partial [Bacteroidales bacterium]|nr:YncE family protein [Bacteroidales bacterium]